LHPQSFLKTFWRLELRPQVFVAMSYSPRYEARYREVIEPAIRSLQIDKVSLEPYRVDISKSGDSILTDISDGIAHCRLVLADVSSVGRDAVTGDPYRNANVMYEVGLALACRQPSDVLLVRDDHDRFLFDVSTVPHVTIAFAEVATARQQVHDELLARLKEQTFVTDARVELAIATLSAEEIILLKRMREYDSSTVWAREVKGIANWYAIATSRLLDKGLIRLAGEFPDDKPAFMFTPLGFIVHRRVNAGLRQFGAPAKPDAVQPPAASATPESDA